MIEAIAQPDSREQCFGPWTRVGRGQARDAQRHHRVLHRREFRQQVVELEHEPDMPVAKRDPRLVVHRRDAVFADRDVAAVDRIQAAEHVQQRALPHSGRAHDRDHLALLDGQVEIAQDVQALARGGVELVEPRD